MSAVRQKSRPPVPASSGRKPIPSSLFKPSVLRVHWEDVNLNFFYFSLADARHAVVEVDNVSLAAKLVDLPCVIGSLKTLDRQSFYKTADVSQVWTSFLNLFTLISF